VHRINVAVSGQGLGNFIDAVLIFTDDNDFEVPVFEVIKLYILNKPLIIRGGFIDKDYFQAF